MSDPPKGCSAKARGGRCYATDYIERLTEERNHWKANHDEQVRKKRVTADYRDGFATELDHAEAEIERLRAAIAAKDDAIRGLLSANDKTWNAAADAARTALGATQKEETNG